MAISTIHPTAFANTAARLARLRKFAWLLDAQFGLPGTKFRFGLNSLIGLAPIAGDVTLGLVSLYLIVEAKRLGAPNTLITKMLGNVAIEVAGGAIPLVGDLFDMTFKANLRNLALLETWIRTAG
ncbi:MAG: DUF4112 domain-containing protein [Pseudomonadota bacterium]|nr:DUF4112 domain-containing protein [Pseudomonadota bacterium]